MHIYVCICIIIVLFRNMEKDVEKRLQEKYELTEKQSQGGGPGGVADRAKGGGGGDSVVSQDVRLVGELDGQVFVPISIISADCQ